jgi:hypothetical protein
MAKFYDCDSKLVYQVGGYPHTEILCNDLSAIVPTTLFGSILPLVVGLLLIFAGGKFLRAISLLIIGFDLVSSYMDFLGIGLGYNLSFGCMLLGMAFLIMGIVLLAKSKIDEYFSLSG